MKESDNQMIPLETLNDNSDNSVVFHSNESIAFAHRKLTQINKQFKDYIREERSKTVHSRIQAPPKKQPARMRRDTIKDVSKGALFLLKQKSILLTHIFETEEKKQELNKRIGKRKSLELGYASGLLLEKKGETANLKLSLSRRKARFEQFIHTQYLFNCKVQALLAMATIFTSILEYENTVIYDDDYGIIHTFDPYNNIYNNTNNLNENYYKRIGRVSHICSYLTFILSVFLWISIYFDKTLIKILLDGHKEKSIKLVMGSFKKFFKFLFSILVFFFCPNPFTYKIVVETHNNESEKNYNIPLNSVFTSICLFRIYFVFKLYLVSSGSYSQRSFRISKINGVQLGLHFPFKANMTDSSLIITGLLFMMCLLVCSYDLRIFERYFDDGIERNLGNYLNDLWCVFITMTTVGYGDISPISLFGRIIIIISCMFGVFLMGLMVVSVTSYLNIVGVESNVYKILLKSKKMEERNKLAFKAITQYLKSIKQVNKKKLVVSKDYFMNKIVPVEKKQINNYLNDFKIADLDFLSTIPALNEYDNIGDHLRFLEENMTKNQDKVVEIVDLLDQLNSVFHNA